MYPEAVTKLHVIHCVDTRRAKKIYEAISRAFEYHQPQNGVAKKLEADATKLVKNNKIQPNNRENQSKTKARSQTDVSRCRNGSKSGKGNFSEIPCEPNKGNITKSESAPDVTRTKSRTKSSTQAKGVEGLGLLDNVDPDEGFDDEFTEFARFRSSSESFKLFGR